MTWNGFREFFLGGEFGEICEMAGVFAWNKVEFGGTIWNFVERGGVCVKEGRIAWDGWLPMSEAVCAQAGARWFRVFGLTKYDGS